MSFTGQTYLMERKYLRNSMGCVSFRNNYKHRESIKLKRPETPKPSEPSEPPLSNDSTITSAAAPEAEYDVIIIINLRKATDLVPRPKQIPC